MSWSKKKRGGPLAGGNLFFLLGLVLMKQSTILEVFVGSSVRFIHRRSGKVFVVDTKEMRHQRKRRKISAWLKYHQDDVNLGKQRSKPYDAVFVTLTYREMNQFEPGQIRAYIKLIKERLKGKLVAYAWVCEVTKNRVPHYHVLFVVKRGTRIRKPDLGDWQYGFSNIQKCYKGLYYIISYLKKSFDGDLPKNARCFGVFSLGEIKKYIRRDCLPMWLQQFIFDHGVFFNSESTFCKVSGGWMVNDELIYTPYMVSKNLVTGCVEVF